MRRVPCLMAAITTLVMFGGVARAATTVADLELRRISVDVSSARPDDRVVFKAYAANLGPGSSRLDVTYSDAGHLFVRREVCIIPGAGGGPNPDTPSCEFTKVSEGDPVVVKIVGFVVGHPGQRVRLTFCTSNETGFPDSNPTNDCQTARIPIVAG